MPAVKKPPKNGFSFYMDEYIPDLKRQGIRINHKQEAVEHLLGSWKSLSKADKEPYEEMAREWKIQHHGRNARPDNEKLDCFGIPVINHDSYEQIQKSNAPRIEDYIAEYTDAFLSGEVELAIISYESMYEDPDETGYLPVEYCIGRYNLRDGLFDFLTNIIDPGPPEYGLKAEVRQFAVQTHHIDQFNNLHAEVLEQHRSVESLEMHWFKMVDKMHESQNKNSQDEAYLTCGTELHIPTFSTRRQLLRNEGCNTRMRQEFASMSTIAHNEHNAKYFETNLIQPLVVECFIKRLYTVHNRDKPPHQQKQCPSQPDLDRDIDRPFACIDNPIRCDYHETIDCDHCAKMEVHRAVYAISKHLTILGYIDKETTGGHHYPPEEANYTIGTSTTTFVYEKTENQKRFERRQRMAQNTKSNFSRPPPPSMNRAEHWSATPPRDYRVTSQTSKNTTSQRSTTFDVSSSVFDQPSSTAQTETMSLSTRITTSSQSACVDLTASQEPAAGVVPRKRMIMRGRGKPKTDQ